MILMMKTNYMSLETMGSTIDQDYWDFWPMLLFQPIKTTRQIMELISKFLLTQPQLSEILITIYDVTDLIIIHKMLKRPYFMDINNNNLYLNVEISYMMYQSFIIEL